MYYICILPKDGKHLIVETEDEVHEIFDKTAQHHNVLTMADMDEYMVVYPLADDTKLDLDQFNW